jgi:UDP-3-O-[3-hydroxymyristoyl] glucosamine N-acyltransferase
MNKQLFSTTMDGESDLHMSHMSHLSSTTPREYTYLQEEQNIEQNRANAVQAQELSAMEDMRKLTAIVSSAQVGDRGDSAI